MTIDYEIGQEVFFIEFRKVAKTTIERIVIDKEKGILLCGDHFRAKPGDVALSPEALFDVLEGRAKDDYERWMADIAEQRKKYQEEKK